MEKVDQYTSGYPLHKNLLCLWKKKQGLTKKNLNKVFIKIPFWQRYIEI